MQQEAVLSSRIEGTRASLPDLLLFDVQPDAAPEGSDVREVRNYVTALERGLKRIESLPIGRRLIRELHAILMMGVRAAYGRKFLHFREFRCIARRPFAGRGSRFAAGHASAQRHPQLV